MKEIRKIKAIAVVYGRRKEVIILKKMEDKSNE